MLKNKSIKIAFFICMLGFYLLHILVFDYYINDLAISFVFATINSIFIGLVIWVLSISDLVDDTEKFLKSDEK